MPGAVVEGVGAIVLPPVNGKLLYQVIVLAPVPVAVRVAAVAFWQ